MKKCLSVRWDKGEVLVGENNVENNCMTIHFIPAMAGDCILVELDNNDCILIDCGYTSTYENELKPLLEELNNKGCRIVLMVITHMDQDHLEGALSLIKENGMKEEPKIIPIEEIWFNGFLGTLFSNYEFEGHRVDEISDKSMVLSKLGDLQMRLPAKSKNISADQSKCFEELCAENGYVLNRMFVDMACRRVNEEGSEKPAEVSFGEFQIRVLNPGIKELDKLAHELHKQMTRNFGKDYTISSDPKLQKVIELMLEMHAENNIFQEKIGVLGKKLENWIGSAKCPAVNAVNRSGIVFEFFYKGKKLLFMGDSDSSIWEKFLADSYDLIKVSHHGTYSPNKAWIEHTKAKVLLISTNGGRQKRHPEKELLAQVILKENKRIYFNYRVHIAEELETLTEQYGFNVEFGVRQIYL